VVSIIVFPGFDRHQTVVASEYEHTRESGYALFFWMNYESMLCRKKMFLNFSVTEAEILKNSR
jgi:hypothetical protein